MKMTLTTVALALATNYGVHVGSSFAYTRLCLPDTIWDLLRSIVTTASPMCSLVLNVMGATQTSYASIVSVSLASLIKTSLGEPN